MTATEFEVYSNCCTYEGMGLVMNVAVMARRRRFTWILVSVYESGWPQSAMKPHVPLG